MNIKEIPNYAIMVNDGTAEIFKECTCITARPDTDFMLFDTEEEMMEYITDNNLTMEDA